MEYNFERDLQPIVTGDVELPNFERIDPDLVIQNIAACGHRMQPVWGHAKIDGHKKWAQYFLFGAGMSSPPHTYGGDGYVLVYPNHVGQFACCKHEFELGAGANPRRGWHPGRCKKCGLDMSVDSGD